MSWRSSVVVGAILALSIAVPAAGCGSEQEAGADSTALACSLSLSERGPYAPDTPLGSTLTDEEAEARMAQDGVVGFLAIHATGPWDLSWEIAERQLGSGIHSDLSWIDVSGEISGLYEADDSFGFSDLRVSRSYQGKIEPEPDPLFIGIKPSSPEPDIDAICTVTAVAVGGSAGDDLLDLIDYIEAAQATLE